jgi:ankyrin repeat protein
MRFTHKLQFSYLIYLRCVDSLIKRNADFNAIDSNGLTSIFHSVFKKDAPLIELLINLGANVDHLDVKGWTPLFYAIEQGDDQVIQPLLNNCLDAGYVNTKSYSALDLAKQIREPGMRDLISCRIERKIM